MTTRRAPAEAARRWVLLIGVPLLAASVFTQFYFYIDRVIALLGATLVVVWLARRPGDALRWLVALLPVSVLTLSLLYRLGVPYELVRPLGFWKEALVAAIVVAAIRSARVGDHRLDALDKVALGYVALSTIHLVAPGLLVDGGTDVLFGSRVNGLRIDVVYLLLFLAARHARIPSAQVARAARAFLVVAVAAAALSFWEFFFSSSWNSLVNDTIGLTRYKLDVLAVRPGTDPLLFDTRIYSEVGGRDVLRIGGILVNYQSFAYFLLLGVCLLAERQVRGLGRANASAALALLGAGILFTQTRSAVLALGVALLLVLRRRAGRDREASVRFAVVVGGAMAVALPVVIAIGLGDRITGGDEASDELHQESSSKGFAALLDEPLGGGLATAAGAGQVEDASTALVSENQLLQIGTQLGLLGLALWLATYALAIRQLGIAAGHAGGGAGDRSPPGDATAVAGATRLGLLALVPAGLFLQVFIWLPTAWPHWALAGAALGARELHRGTDDRIVPQQSLA